VSNTDVDTRVYPGDPPPHYNEVVAFLQTFFPQFFDPESPQYVDPDILTQLIWIAEDARPWCLPDRMQNYAQALYTAYLVSLRGETSSGQTNVPVAGPITMEKEGDITVQYGSSQPGSNTKNTSTRPPSDPWDLWNKLWTRCGMGAITTRYGDPARSVSGQQLTNQINPLAKRVWYPIDG
jgi:hypothetical protein